MKRTEKGDYRIGMGASTMLMIFAALSLATLSILALMSARADAALEQRGRAMTIAYYEAADRAQRVLSQLDARVAAAQSAARDEAEYRQEILQITADDVEIEFENTDLCRFSIEAGENRRLSVSVELAGYKMAGPRCRVVRHVLEGASLWSDEDGGLEEIF